MSIYQRCSKGGPSPATIDSHPFFVRDCDLDEVSFGDTVEFVVDCEEAEC